MFLKLLLSLLPLFAVAQPWPTWGGWSGGCRTDGICRNFRRMSDCWPPPSPQDAQELSRCCICTGQPPPGPPRPPNPPPSPPNPPPSPPGNPGPCSDNDSFRWAIQSETRDCRYIRDNGESLRRQQCGRRLERGPNAGVEIRDMCRRTCNNCGCEDDNSFTWNIQSHRRDCRFLENQASAALRRQQCERRLTHGDNFGVRINEVCRRTCNNCGGGPAPSPSNGPPSNPPPGNCDAGRNNGHGCQGANSCWRDSQNHQCSWYEVRGNWGRRPRCEQAWEWATGPERRSASRMCCFCSWQYQGLRESGQKADASKVSSLEE